MYVPDVFPTAGARAEAPDSADASQATSLRDLFVLLRRQRWLIIAGTCLGTGLAVVAASLSDPQYTATASVVIDPYRAPIEEVNLAAPSLTVDRVTMTTQVNVIRSRPLMTAVMEDLGLFDHPGLNPAVAKQEEERTAAAAGSDGELLDSFLEVPRSWLKSLRPSAEAAPVDPSDAALERFASRFAVNQAGESRVINIGFTFGEPEVAARVVNRAAELYIDEQLKSKLMEAERQAAWIGDRIATVSGEVREAEAAAEAYRSARGLTSEGASAPEQQQLTALNQSLIAVRAELFALEARLERVRQLSGSDTSAVLNVLTSPFLVSLRDQELELLRREAELSTTYGERHPQIQLLRADQRRVAERISQETSRLVADLQGDIAGHRRQIAELEAGIAESTARSYERSEAGVGLRELEREAEAGRQLLQVLLARSKETSEQSAVLRPDAQVISYAKPPTSPSSVGPRIFAVLGFTIALSGSTLLALVVEGLDRRVRSARQIERLFGLRVLDVVPPLPRQRGECRPHQYIARRPLSAYTEALRSVYTTVQFSGGSKRPRVVLVTSALASEGKTTFAASLAAIAAQWHERVVLVELDLRHPSVPRVTGVRPTGCLSEVLYAQAPLDHAIQTTDAGFDTLCIAHRIANPTGLIGSRAMMQTIEELRNRYDLVVLDSPPLLAVSDARVATRLADKVALVVRWRHTPVSAVRRAVQMLRDSHADIAGFVLLRVNSRRYMYYENEDGADYHANIKKYYVN